MIKIAVVSGKGGTGKTVVTAALADLIPGALVLADCDVDAANLPLLIAHETHDIHPYYGLSCASIDPAQCVRCGACKAHCRFGAIKEDDAGFHINQIHCEGCGVCLLVCPEDAITLEPRQAGEILMSASRRGPLSHARLFPGSGTSGLLVQKVKEQALEHSTDQQILLIDGPPGIGCPAMATIGGLDAAVIVTEPSISAIHDLKRLVQVCKGFQTRLFLVINHADLDSGQTSAISDFCRAENIPLLGCIPSDREVITAVREGRPVTATECPAASALRVIWKNLAAILEVDR